MAFPSVQLRQEDCTSSPPGQTFQITHQLKQRRDGDVGEPPPVPVCGVCCAVKHCMGTSGSLQNPGGTSGELFRFSLGWVTARISSGQSPLTLCGSRDFTGCSWHSWHSWTAQPGQHPSLLGPGHWSEARIAHCSGKVSLPTPSISGYHS